MPGGKQVHYINKPKNSVEQKQFLTYWNNCSLADIFGFQLYIQNNDPVFDVTNIRTWHRGGGGSDAINGGIIAALCDYTIGMVGIFNLPDGKKFTTDLKINFKKPLEGSSFKVIGQADQVSTNMVKSNAKVYDQNNLLCSIANGRVLLTSS